MKYLKDDGTRWYKESGQFRNDLEPRTYMLYKDRLVQLRDDYAHFEVRFADMQADLLRSAQLYDEAGLGDSVYNRVNVDTKARRIGCARFEKVTFTSIMQAIKKYKGAK